MIAAAIAIAVLTAAIGIAVLTTLYLRRDRVQLPEELAERRRQLRRELQELIAGLPETPALLSAHLPEHPRTAAVEAKLIGSNPRGALAEAEAVLAESPGDARAHLLLARALIYSDELDAAEQQLGRARDLGDDSPMLWFLGARSRHLRQLRELHADNAEIQSSPLPSMVSPLEVLILSLERQRRLGDAGSGVWIPGKGQISDEQIAKMVTVHLTRYYDALEELLRAARAIPGFAGALYHCARMALKVGFVDEGRRLFDAIEPLMTGSPEKPFYERDLAQLREEKSSLVSPLPKLEGTARRASKLRVIE
jgi:hypothetical protein